MAAPNIYLARRMQDFSDGESQPIVVADFSKKEP